MTTPTWLRQYVSHCLFYFVLYSKTHFSVRCRAIEAPPDNGENCFCLPLNQAGRSEKMGFNRLVPWLASERPDKSNDFRPLFVGDSLMRKVIGSVGESEGKMGQNFRERKMFPSPTRPPPRTCTSDNACTGIIGAPVLIWMTRDFLNYFTKPILSRV